ncbi:MAG: hypothetical protein U0804_09875 [Gemmataceae bacterium]
MWVATATYHPVAHLMSERTKRLYAVGCARLTPRPLPFPLLDEAIEVVEQAADGLADEAAVEVVHRAALAVSAECKSRPEGWWSPLHYLAIAAERLAGAAGQEHARTVPGFLFEALGGKHDRSYPPDDIREQARRTTVVVFRDVLYHPYRDTRGRPLRAPRRVRRPPQLLRPTWRTEAVVGLARGMYESRDFGPMPVLADALEDAGCTDPDLLGHCRSPGPHVRGCWVVDLILGKE